MARKREVHGHSVAKEWNLISVKGIVAFGVDMMPVRIHTTSVKKHSYKNQDYCSEESMALNQSSISFRLAAAAILPLAVVVANPAQAEKFGIEWDFASAENGSTCCYTQAGLSIDSPIGPFDTAKTFETGVGINSQTIYYPVGIGGHNISVVVRVRNQQGEQSGFSNVVTTDLPPRDALASISGGALWWRAFNGYAEEITNATDVLPANYEPVKSVVDPGNHAIWVVTKDKYAEKIRITQYSTDNGVQIQSHDYGPFPGASYKDFRFDPVNNAHHVFWTYADGRISNWIMKYDSENRDLCTTQPDRNCYFQQGPATKEASTTPWDTYNGKVTWEKVTMTPAAADPNFILWTFPAVATPAGGTPRNVLAMEIWRINPLNGRVIQKFTPINTAGQPIVSFLPVAGIAYSQTKYISNPGMLADNPASTSGKLLVMFAGTGSSSPAKILQINPGTHVAEIFEKQNSPYLTIDLGSTGAQYRPYSIEVPNGAGPTIRFVGNGPELGMVTSCKVDQNASTPATSIAMEAFPEGNTSYCTTEALSSINIAGLRKKVPPGLAPIDLFFRDLGVSLLGASEEVPRPVICDARAITGGNLLEMPPILADKRRKVWGTPKANMGLPSAEFG